MVNSQDNQGASADADRAATASQPSQQAVSGIAGIPSATPLPLDDVRYALATASIAMKPVVSGAGPATLCEVIDHAMELVNRIGIRAKELGDKTAADFTLTAWCSLYDARKAIEDRAVA